MPHQSVNVSEWTSLRFDTKAGHEGKTKDMELSPVSVAIISKCPHKLRVQLAMMRQDEGIKLQRQ